MKPHFDDESALDTPQDIVKYFQGLVNVVTNFTSHATKEVGSKRRMQYQKDEKAAEQILDFKKCPSNFRVNLSHQDDRTKEQTQAERDLHEQEQDLTLDRVKYKEESQKTMQDATRRSRRIIATAVDDTNSFYRWQRTHSFVASTSEDDFQTFRTFLPHAGVFSFFFFVLF